MIPMTDVVFVSVEQTFDESMTIPELEERASWAWGTTVQAVKDADRVVAVKSQRPVAAWVLRGAYPTASYTYSKGNGDERPRIALDLGDPLPILPAYGEVPNMRRGIRVIDLDVQPLPHDRPLPSGL